MSRKTIVFIDAEFLSKWSKYLGNTQYLKFDIIGLSQLIAKKRELKTRINILLHSPTIYLKLSNKRREEKKREL